VTSLEPVAQLPDVPPIAATIPGFECTTWVSFFAPTGTPKAIIDRLNTELGTAMRDPGISSRLSTLTYDALHKQPEELNQRVKADYEKIGKLFRDFGVKLD
jgi:tripartite-type tricarboxylate transporter receptor subunit TctC